VGRPISRAASCVHYTLTRKAIYRIFRRYPAPHTLVRLCADLVGPGCGLSFTIFSLSLSLFLFHFFFYNILIHAKICEICSNFEIHSDIKICSNFQKCSNFEICLYFKICSHFKIYSHLKICSHFKFVQISKFVKIWNLFTFQILFIFQICLDISKMCRFWKMQKTQKRIGRKRGVQEKKKKNEEIAVMGRPSTTAWFCGVGSRPHSSVYRRPRFWTWFKCVWA
jgi:hypothetical protein